MIEIKFEGLEPEQLIKELHKLGDALQEKAVYAGLTELAKPIKQHMKAYAPKKTGALSESIGQRRISKTARARLGIPVDQAAILVGPLKKVRGKYQGYKANWMEKGTKPHDIKPRKLGGSLKFFAYSKLVHHPGTRPTWFMKRADDSSERQQQAAFFYGMSRYLDRARRRGAF